MADSTMSAASRQSAEVCTSPVGGVKPDVLITAAAYVQREYGYTGYRLGVYAASWTGRSGIFEVKATDGSRFYVHADEYGNARTGDLNEITLPPRPETECSVGY